MVVDNSMEVSYLHTLIIRVTDITDSDDYTLKMERIKKKIQLELILPHSSRRKNCKKSHL